ncbi:MAG: relaxase/mobilization nuclease domain-containing protein [Tissierellaceae bacterium]
MAIVKFINGQNREVAGLIRAIDYIADENKTEIFNIEHEDKESIFIEKLLEEKKVNRAINYITKDNKTSAHLVTGINCSSNPDTVFDEMMITKRLYNKEGGRQFIHFTHSYSSEEKDLSPELAHEISLKLIEHERFKGFQILAATHIDKDHIHTHFILNTVNEETGLKWQQSDRELQELKKYSNQLCLGHGLKHSIVPLRNEKQRGISMGEIKAKEKGRSWKYEAFHAINDARKTAISKDDFISKLEIQGYKVRWVDNRKDIQFSFLTPDGKARKLNADKLHPPENFTKEALLKKFNLNKQYQNISKQNILNNQFDARQELVLQTIRKLEDDPINHDKKDYPRQYLEGQALKEKMKEKAKGEGLDWEGEQEK